MGEFCQVSGDLLESVFGSNGSVKILKAIPHVLFSHYSTVSVSTEDLGPVVVIQESILA